MRNFDWRIIRHSELTKAEKILISELKDQHWHHGIDSQLQWMHENILDEDYHLFREEKRVDGRKINAYMSLAKVSVRIEGELRGFIGIGNVCVEKSLQHTGLGRILLNKANEYILEKKEKGILLCRDSLIEFYRKCGWTRIYAKSAKVAGQLYERELMVFPKLETRFFSRIDVDRGF